MKYDRADLALNEPIPMRDMNREGDNELLEEVYQKKRENWLGRNVCVMEACSLHDEVKQVVKVNTRGTTAAVVVKNLRNRFKIIQQSVKQSEIEKKWR